MQNRAVSHTKLRIFAPISAFEFDLKLGSSSLSAVRVHLRFAPSASVPLRFRLGPIFVSDSDRIAPGEVFRAEWTVLPVPEFRLTAPASQRVRPNI